MNNTTEHTICNLYRFQKLVMVVGACVYDNAVLYAGELMTVDKSGYKKHYFVEGERILTGIGGGGNSAIQYYTELNTITGEHPKILSEQYFYGYVSPYFTEHENNCNNNPLPAEADMRDVPDLQQSFKYALVQNVRDIQYYWLADRIGSGSIVTNSAGNPVHVLANIPFGENLLDLSSAFETPYQYAGYEYDMESMLEYAHARYYAGMKRYNSFLSTDPMWSKYPSLNAYHYSMNQPITLRDPSGMVVTPADGDALTMIQNTLTAEDRQYVRFDKSGNIDKDYLNSHTSESGNFNKLKELVNSPIKTNVAIVSDGWNYMDNDGNIVPNVKKQPMVYQGLADWAVDTEGYQNTNDTSQGDVGRLGVTLLPGKGQSGINSPNNEIYVYINALCTPEGQAEMYSHEANGHALSYVRTFSRFFSGHHFASGGLDLNYTLKKMILNSKKETVQNMKK